MGSTSTVIIGLEGTMLSDFSAGTDIKRPRLLDEKTIGSDQFIASSSTLILPIEFPIQNLLLPVFP